MADIFISHSSQDNEAAAAIGERVRRERPTWSLFYDKDNISAGQRWQERLREELQSCRVVLAVVSRNWLASPWCFTEVVTASSLLVNWRRCSRTGRASRMLSKARSPTMRCPRRRSGTDLRRGRHPNQRIS
jgi:hypothetical protein